MSERYTKTDCGRALIRLAQTTGRQFITTDAVLIAYAKQLGVETAQYMENTKTAYSLERAPDGGYRPVVYDGMSTRQSAPIWWYSSGLGHAATSARVFCRIVSAVDWALQGKGVI